MSQPNTQPATAEQQKINTLPLNHELINRDGGDYKISTDISSELRVATLAYLSIQQEFNRIGKTVKNYQKPNIQRLEPFVQAMVESIIRNPAAAVWLARLKRKGSYA